MRTENIEKKPQFPDNERKEVDKALKSKEWGHCPKCDWFYKRSVIDRCPMCRHLWRSGKTYKQPQYENSGL